MQDIRNLKTYCGLNLDEPLAPPMQVAVGGSQTNRKLILLTFTHPLGPIGINDLQTMDPNHSCPLMRVAPQGPWTTRDIRWTKDPMLRLESRINKWRRTRPLVQQWSRTGAKKIDTSKHLFVQTTCRVSRHQQNHFKTLGDECKIDPPNIHAPLGGAQA